MSEWVLRLALRLVPSSWRESVRLDLEQDAGGPSHRLIWQALHAMLIGLQMRATVGTAALSFDLRYAVRSLGNSRWFTAGATLTFALGIGVNMAVFSAVDRILFRPLPFEDPDRLVLLRVCRPDGSGCSSGSFPDPVALDAGDRLQTLGEMTLFGGTGEYPTVAGGGVPVRLTQAWPNAMRVLGVKPIAGRDVLPDEVRDSVPVAFLAHEVWAHRFQRDPSMIGKPLAPGPNSPIVIGILPPGFVVPGWGIVNPEWEGVVLTPSLFITAPIARLRPGQSIEAAQAEVGAFAASLAPKIRRPNAPADSPLPFIKVDRLEGVLFDRFEAYAWLVTAASTLVFLMACANLAGLLLARGRSREHDAAMRTAIGASAGRIIVASVVETSIVCLAGTAVALIALAWTSSSLAAILPPIFARYMAGTADARIIGMALIAAFLCATIAGAWPGARLARVDVIAVLKRTGGAGRPTRLRGGRTLLAFESALGIVLVLAAALAIRSFAVLATEDVGFDSTDLYRISATPLGRDPRTPTDPNASLAEYREMLDVAAHVPGVVAVAGGDTVMATGSSYVYRFGEDKSLRGSRMEIGAGFFATVRSQLIAGREFSAEEVAARAPVAMLNPDGVSQLWPGLRPGDAVGRFVTLTGEPGRLVVGIVPRLLKNSRGEEDRPMLYVPLGTRPRYYSSFLIRMSPGMAPSIETLRARLELRMGPRQLRIANVTAALDTPLPEPRFRAVLFGVFALGALLLAAAGLYALAAFEVSLRRYEIGVRMTLGASASTIQRGVVAAALRPVVIGIVAGCIAAWWAGQFLQTYLYRTNVRDPWMWGLVAGVLLGTAALAAWLPARRAARTDPAIVLRAQ